ncbi:MAG: dTDP-4-amino-4,6-dideoxygalactose transaminase [Roseivirga sp.]|jgi:dTDP-4-amino-4,6-dideoxygalactose transaminase
MKIPYLDLKRQYEAIQRDMDRALNSILSEQQFVGGSGITSFESKFAKAHDSDHCIGVANATDALFIILKSLKIGVGDEVIVPAHGWLSAAEMVALTGAQVVFADVELETFGIDPVSVVSKINTRTKAIIAIHLYGQICKIEELHRLSEQHKIHLIEDCAQSHFASLNGTLAGSWGIASAFSFYPSKILGAYGDGGAILTSNNELALACRKFANHGGLSKNDHEIKGINSRMDTLQAEVLSVKLNFVGEWIEKRRVIAEFYSQSLEGIGDISVPATSDHSKPNFHIYTIRTKQRDTLKAHLENSGISTEVHYPLATPFTTAFNEGNFQAEDFPVGYQLQNELLSLPIFPELTLQEIAFIVQQIKLFFS